MAIFNQQHQIVQHQVNGEQINVGTDGFSTPVQIDRLLEELVQRLHAEQERLDVARAALTHVEAARAASRSGDKRGVVAFLARAAEAAAPVATLANSVAAVAAMVAVWHD